jgi:asparagine synthase (glutamine-hydrolysing)
MCGIAGFIGRRAIEPARLTACMQAMRHRGPDATGSYSTRTRDGHHVHLLHARLSIIDLDHRADQPIHFGSRIMICNGELYNYRELSAKYGWGERELRTACDTEVLLRVVAERGVAGLDDCEGMWAFAMYDEANSSLMLCRDRFGEKPLYVYAGDGGIYFGSEVKIIQALLGGPLTVNHTHVRRYLVNGYKSLYKNDQTFFEGLEELRAGTVRVLRGGTTVSEERYWAHAAPQTAWEGSYDDVVEEVQGAVIRAVDLRLRADVPVGFLLSGGMDSNTIAAVARRVLGVPVRAFTIVSDDERYDERVLAQRSADELGIELKEVEPAKEEFLPALRALVKKHDAPVYTISYMAHACLLRQLAEDGCKVSISGSGGDELFAGYYDHHLAHLYELRDDRPSFDAALRGWSQHIRPCVRNPFLQDAFHFVNNPAARDHIYFDAHEFGSFLHGGFAEPFVEQNFTPDLLRNRMLNELFHEAIPPILHEDDHNAMAMSVENRAPLLDRSLFELSRRIPAKWLIRDGFGKAVLRDAMKGIVPDSIRCERRKVGFNLSLDSLLDRSDERVRREVLAESPVFDIVKREAVAALLAAPSLPNSRSKFLFSFLSAKMFLEEFCG